MMVPCSIVLKSPNHSLDQGPADLIVSAAFDIILSILVTEDIGESAKIPCCYGSGSGDGAETLHP